MSEHTAAVDLWPADFMEPDEPSPLVILRQQAALLGQKTKNVVTAEVRTSRTKPSEWSAGFYLVAPVLQYQFHLFSVLFDPGTLYPMRFWVDDADTEVANEADFRAKLAEVLGSPRTRRIIGNLLAHSRA
jgi:hypothetical protein